jgi:FAD/FMN-containing dehydrogenase
LANWGNYPVVDAACYSFDSIDGLRSILSSAGRTVARGLGRSYGDASLGPHVVSTSRYNLLLDFAPDTGLLRCQGGASLLDLLRVAVPRGWFLPVTPGTKFVTVGGAVAADVHGKNHHRDGSFCRHVERLSVMLAEGDVRTCSREKEPDLFRATCGGLGLTGIVLEAAIRLRPIETAYIRQETVRARDLDHIMKLFESSAGYSYSVAWIDCLAGGSRLGRSIMLRGEPAGPGDLRHRAQREAPLAFIEHRHLDVPVPMPWWVLNRGSIGLFNALYYRRSLRRAASCLVHLDPFFYPLDGVYHWNRIYGRRGFVQYQFVLPRERSRAGLVRILERIHRAGRGSFLAVLKLLGEGGGAIGFPREGYTLALDFPLRPGLLRLLDSLDELVAAYGGRHYLVKDARLSREVFAATYPEARAFQAQCRRWDPAQRFRSRLSDRLGLSGPEG